MNIVAYPVSTGWPLLVYRAVLAEPTPEAFEALFEANGWPPAWRSGVYGFHHFHTTAHEALGVYEGEVTVQFGGEAGVTVTARAGDVVVLAAGVAHKKVSAQNVAIVGAYPVGQSPDMNRGQGRAVRPALPRADPVRGAGGPLFEHWR